MKKSIQLNLDDNLLATLKDAFTSTQSIFGELMQNALRAKATEIRFEIEADGVSLNFIDDLTRLEANKISASSIKVTDNGIGINDFQNLFSIGRTGWDTETQEKTSPYGVGFLSAISSCDYIKVTSNNMVFEGKTNDILAMKSIGVKKSTASDPEKTAIVMTGGILPTAGKIWIDIEQLSKGFPIKVYVNNLAMERPDVVDESIISHANIDGNIFHLNGVHNDEPANRFTKIYLQGLPVNIECVSRHARKHEGNFGKMQATYNILHLNPEKYRARMPDREVLLDSHDVSLMINTVTEQLWHEFLNKKKEELDGKAFVEQYWDIVFKPYSKGPLNFKKIFNDVPYLPSNILSEVNEYPMMNSSGNVEFTTVNLSADKINHAISKADFISLDKNIFFIDDLDRWNSNAIEPNCALAYMYLYGCKEDSYIIEDHQVKNFDKEHWLITEQLVRIVENGTVEDHFDYTLNGDVNQNYFSLGDWVSFETFFVDSVTITHKESGKHVEITDDAFLLPESGVVITKGANDGEVIHQLNAYLDEFDIYLGDKAYDDEMMLQRHIKAVRGDDPEAVLKDVLSDANLQCYSDLFKDKSFTFKLDKESKIIEIALVK